MLLYLREQSYSDKLALAGCCSEPRVRTRRTRPAARGTARPYRVSSRFWLRSSAAPVSSCRRGPTAVTSPRRPAVRVCRAGTTRDVLGREAQFFSSSAFFLLRTVLGSLARAAPRVRSGTFRGALGAPGRPFRRPGAASFEPLLFVAGLSWPGKGERRRSGGELPGAGWTGELPPPPGRRGSGAAGRSFVLRPPRRSPPRAGCGTLPRGKPISAARQR